MIRLTMIQMKVDLNTDFINLSDFAIANRFETTLTKWIYIQGFELKNMVTYI